MSLASHLAEQYNTLYPPRAPFGEPIHPSQLAICGPMSFAPQMHGNFSGQPSFVDQSLISMDSTMGISTSTSQKIATLQAKLNKRLGPEYISQRPGPSGGPKLTYVEGWKIINLANEVFGFNNWSSNIVNLSTDFMDYDEQSKRCTVGVSAVIRVTLRDGVFHEDVGYGVSENAKGKGAAFDKAKKEAVTDGVKRALRNFGNLLGNCLYDKQYTQEVVKIKVPQSKFNKDDLHRRAEFQEASLSTTPAAFTSPANVSYTKAVPPNKPPPTLPKAIGANAYAPANKAAPNTHPANAHANNTTPIRNDHSSGLATPAKTPAMVNGKSLSAAQMHCVSKIDQHPQGSRIQQPKHLQSARTRAVGVSAKIDSRPSSGTDGSDTYSFNFDDEELLKLDLDGSGGCHDLEADIGRPIENEQTHLSESGIGPSSDQKYAHSTSSIQAKGSSSNSGSINHARFVAPPKTAPEPHQPELANQSDDDIARQITLLRQRKNAEKVAGVSPSPLNHKNDRCAAPIGASDQQTNQVQSSRPSVRQNPSVVRQSSMQIQSSVPAPAQIPVAATPNPANGITNGITNGRGPPSSTPGNKPRTPSMGGFNFPTGTVLSQQAGMKRPASVLVPQMQGQQSARGGMGLSNVNTGPNGQSRSVPVRRPLAPLDFDGGGDIKRMRV